MYSCPHCNKPGISSLRKNFMGGGLAATCKSCGGKVTVSYWKSVLAIIPMVFALVVFPHIFEDHHMLSLFTILATLLTCTLHGMVPLQKK